jgi:translation initiation factor 2A
VDTKAASKNAKKRANKKNKTPGAGGDDSEGDEQGATSSSGQQQQSSKASSGAAQAAAAGVANLSVSEGAQDGEGGDAAKRVRALQKKLRQIQQLKERLEKEGGLI